MQSVSQGPGGKCLTFRVRLSPEVSGRRSSTLVDAAQRSTETDQLPSKHCVMPSATDGREFLPDCSAAILTTRDFRPVHYLCSQLISICSLLQAPETEELLLERLPFLACH